jgi:hypothetical protein
MDFTLKYRGPLVSQSSGTGGRVREKQAIRRYLHAQLQDLWKGDTNRLARVEARTLQEPTWNGSILEVPRPIRGFDKFFYRYRLGGFNFVPLVTAALEAQCHLDVRLHRASGAGNIVYAGGDLDNWLKVLFDALRIPTGLPELDDVPPTEDGQIVYCLLADDRLITRLSVESFKLLGPRPDDENYVEVDLDVTIQAVTPMHGTTVFLFQ